MYKKLQDILFACLPKEVREHIRNDYKDSCNRYKAINSNLSRGVIDTLEDLFGHHNLTSDTEPEEMLMVERKKVQGLYAAFESRQAEAYPIQDGEFWRGSKSGLKYIFGDKCLSDKQPSVQVEPKFSKGDKVKVVNDAMHNGKIGKVIDIDRSMIAVELDDGTCVVWHERYFEPYTEPETKEPECIHPDSDNCKWKNICDHTQCYFDPIKSETKDMEAKELNLCELLKGCEEEEFYCPYLRNNVKFIGFDEHDGMTFILSLYKDGLGYENLMYIKKNDKIGKSFVLYPSRALYEKYPLDAYSAWMEWKESRKPKRWRAENGDEYWLIDSSGELCTSQEYFSIQDDNYYEFGNYFRTKEEAQLGLEVVREALQKFHDRTAK